MRTALLLATVIAPFAAAAQDRPVDQILKTYTERRARTRTVDDFRLISRDALTSLDAFAAKAPPGDPDLPRARFHAAQMLVSLQDPAGARARLDVFLKEHPDQPELSVTARYFAGELDLELGDEAKARGRFAEFLKTAPAKDERITRARSLAALSFAAEGRYDEALAGLAELRKEDERAAFPVAIVQHLAGRREAAHRTIEAIVKAGSDAGAVEVARRLLTDWLAVDQPMGDWSGLDLKGAPVAPVPGKVLLLYFFAAEYEESSQEGRIMKRLAEAFAGRDLVIVGVATDKRRLDVELFLKDIGATWPVILDGNGFEGPIAKRFGVSSFPRVMIADRQGVLRFVNPICTPHGRELRPVIERLLAAK